ncbi:MAG: DUF5371 family protein, partial [Methermicoccaceae archaeon]
SKIVITWKQHIIIMRNTCMSKIVHAQTVITEDDLNALKEKTGESSTKDSIAKAIEHYLSCPLTEEGEQMWRRRMEQVVEKRGSQER